MDNEALMNCIKQIFCEGFFLIWAADGEIDQLELNKFIEVIDNRSRYFTCPYVRAALSDFCGTNCHNDPKLVLPNAILCVLPDLEDDPSVNNFLSVIKKVLNKIVKDFSMFSELLLDANITDNSKRSILNDLITLMREIARASGGFLGFNKVSDEEKGAFVLAMSALGFDKDLINQFLVDFK